MRSRQITMIDAWPPITSGDVRRHARRIRRKAGGLAAIVVDTVGFLDDIENGDPKTTKHDRQGRALGILRATARELDCVVHLVLHLSRPGVSPDKGPVRPTMTRIRDGGNVEGIAHHIIGVYREKPNEEPENAVLILCKVREGYGGQVKMRFLGARAMFLQEGQERAHFEIPAPTQVQFFVPGGKGPIDPDNVLAHAGRITEPSSTDDSPL